MVHPLLLLWSMLRWGYGIGIAALKDCSVDQWSFERDVASLLESVLSSEEKELFFDFQAISAVSSAAVAEAKSLGCSYVDTHHIIFALLRRDDEVIRGLFAKYGVTYERFKEAVDLLPARWAAQHLPLGEHERMVAQCKIRSA
jgi:ATP-dependent Clp protease ATP-binding subunit ClpA